MYSNSKPAKNQLTDQIHTEEFKGSTGPLIIEGLQPGSAVKDYVSGNDQEN